MSQFLIVKYASDNWPNGAPLEASILTSYTAKMCDITKSFYTSKNEAEKDLKKLKLFNPSVYYGIVPLIKS